MMAQSATRPSQDANESATVSQSAEHDGHASGNRRGSADSFRDLLARLKKSADAVQQEIAPPPAAAEAPVAPLAPQHAVQAAKTATATPAPHHDHAAIERSVAESAELIARERETAAALAAAATRAISPDLSVEQRVDAITVERRARARTEAHVASQEIIARLRRAAAEQAAAKAKAEAQPEPEPPAPQIAAPEEIAATVAEAPVLPQPAAEIAPAPELQPQAQAEEQAPPHVVRQGRRPHPFFPDVFLDDNETGLAAPTAAAPPPPVAEQPVAEQPFETADMAAGIAALISPQEPEPQPVAEAVAQYVEPQVEIPDLAFVAPEAEPAPQPEVPVAESWPVEELPPPEPEPVIEEAPAVAFAPEPEPAFEPPPAPVAEAPEPVVAEVEAASPAVTATPAETEEQHKEDLVEDEADAVRHLRGVEVKGIGDIAKTIFSTPTPAERAAFLAEVAAATAAVAAEPVLAADEQVIAPAPSSVRKIAAADDPFAKIEPDATGFVNHDEPNEDAGELARSLLDMMLSNPNAGLPQERALAADALLKLIPKVPSKALVNIAERLALMDSPPHLLIAKLINDPRIEIAGPLLEQCNHISDQVLSKVVAGGLVSLQRLIARRRHLSSALSDQLIEFDDPSVLLTLVRNNGAAFSHAAFNKLMLHASRHTDALAPLATRADLPPTVAFELFWFVPAELRRYLLSRFLTDSETLTKILKITKVMQGGAEAGDQGFANKEALEAFLTALEHGLGEDALQLLSAMSGISVECARRILSDSQGEPIAIVFKAIGVNRAQFDEYLARLQSPQVGIVNPARQTVELQSTFNSMSFNKARIVLTYWDWAVLKHGPYAETQ